MVVFCQIIWIEMNIFFFSTVIFGFWTLPLSCMPWGKKNSGPINSWGKGIPYHRGDRMFCRPFPVSIGWKQGGWQRGGRTENQCARIHRTARMMCRAPSKRSVFEPAPLWHSFMALLDRSSILGSHPKISHPNLWDILRFSDLGALEGLYSHPPHHVLKSGHSATTPYSEQQNPRGWGKRTGPKGMSSFWYHRFRMWKPNWMSMWWAGVNF